jgi:hypothetical protein
LVIEDPDRVVPNEGDWPRVLHDIRRKVPREDQALVRAEGGIHVVNRNGGNQLRGSVYYRFRDDGLVGREAPSIPAPSSSGGGVAGSPEVRDTLSFFVSLEDERLTTPGTTFRARADGETVQGNTTRVRASDLDALADYLRSRFGYDPGALQGLQPSHAGHPLPGQTRLQPGDRNKVSLRYAHLDSSTDALLSNAPLLGFGNRRSSEPATIVTEI